MSVKNDPGLLQKISDAKKFKKCVHFVEYVTVEEYLLLLELFCLLLQQEWSNFVKKSTIQQGTMPDKKIVPVLFLASAVSDFYIPFDLLPEHKMQSRQVNPIAKES